MTVWLSPSVRVSGCLLAVSLLVSLSVSPFCLCLSPAEAATHNRVTHLLTQPARAHLPSYKPPARGVPRRRPRAKLGSRSRHRRVHLRRQWMRTPALKSSAEHRRVHLRTALVYLIQYAMDDNSRPLTCAASNPPPSQGNASSRHMTTRDTGRPTPGKPRPTNNLPPSTFLERSATCTLLSFRHGDQATAHSPARAPDGAQKATRTTPARLLERKETKRRNDAPDQHGTAGRPSASP